MQVFGRYEVLERLGGGGMAEVFRARAVGPEGFSKEVALKRVLPQHAADPEFAAMFVEEARLAAGLSHANIVQVLDFGKVGDSHFLTMEWVDGVDLARVVDEAHAQGRRIPPEVALRITAEALEGLGFAHAKRVDGRSLGIVHRDISPSNILVSWAGEVRVADFGIAAAAGRAHFTQTNFVRGKPQYMSPEQATGRTLDGRSDLFAMGLVLHELLTGRAVFADADPSTVLERVERADVPRPSAVASGLPAGIDELVRRAVTQLPEKRYATAAAFRRDIEELAAEQRLRLSPAPVAAFLASLFQRGATAPRTVTALPRDETRTPRASGAVPVLPIAAGVVVLVVGLAIGLNGYGPGARPKTVGGATPRATLPIVVLTTPVIEPTREVAQALPSPPPAALPRETPRGTTAKATPHTAATAASAAAPAPIPGGEEKEFRTLAELNVRGSDWIGARENFGRAVRVRAQNRLPTDPALDASLARAKAKCQQIAADQITEARADEEHGDLEHARSALRLAILHAAPGTRELASATQMLERLGGSLTPAAQPSPSAEVELPWMIKDRERSR